MRGAERMIGGGEMAKFRVLLRDQPNPVEHESKYMNVDNGCLVFSDLMHIERIYAPGEWREVVRIPEEALPDDPS